MNVLELGSKVLLKADLAKIFKDLAKKLLR